MLIDFCSHILVCFFIDFGFTKIPSEACFLTSLVKVTSLSFFYGVRKDDYIIKLEMG